MSNFRPQIVLDHKCLLGEGPVWDAERQIICWIDILNGELHQFSSEQKSSHSIIKLPEMIGCFSRTSDGRFITAMKNGFAFVSLDGKDISPISDPELHLPGNRFNDGKCDPSGRFWAGTMSLAEEKGAGSLYTLHHDLKFVKKISDVTISNGLAWTRDKKKMYYIDTPTSQIASFDYDDETGNITSRKVAFTIAKEDGYPDGMTIDAEDMLWIAHWDGWQISRWNPVTGERLLKIEMPVARVTSCAFGGSQLEDLFITTARKELTTEQLAKQPFAGSLFVIKNCGKGLPASTFIVN